jgi:ribonuclease HI
VLAKTAWFSPLCDVAIGEAVSLHTTLEWVSDLQFDNVDFALDSKKVVDSFHTCVVDNSEFGCIINACRQLFYDRFQNSHVEFNRR